MFWDFRWTGRLIGCQNDGDSQARGPGSSKVLTKSRSRIPSCCGDVETCEGASQARRRGRLITVVGSKLSVNSWRKRRTWVLTKEDLCLMMIGYREAMSKLTQGSVLYNKRTRPAWQYLNLSWWHLSRQSTVSEKHKLHQRLRESESCRRG